MQTDPKTWRAGLGLRREFINEVVSSPLPDVDFFEIHPENYIARGGEPVELLEKIVTHTPLATHGLSLSIGGPDPLNFTYLGRVRDFLRKHKITWHTDHICWSSAGGHQYHDLLPLPFTKEAISHVAERARIVQDFLEVPFGLENVSFYLHPEPPEMTEAQFFLEVLDRAGVSALLDVNNLYVNALNHGSDPLELINSIDPKKILHIHVAGHERRTPTLVIDTHGQDVPDPVWSLLQKLAARGPLAPVLIERDNDIPELSILLNEVRRAQTIAKASHAIPHRIAV